MITRPRIPLRTIAVAVATHLSIAAELDAAVTITVLQEGNDIRVTGSGSVDLSSATFIMDLTDLDQTFAAVSDSDFVSIFPEVLAGLMPASASRYIVSGLAWDIPDSLGFPLTSFGIEGDPAAGFYFARNAIFVPTGYVSNAPLDFTAIVRDFRLADYGYSHGDTINVAWSGAPAGPGGSFTMTFLDPIPEPSTVLLSCIAAAGFAVRRNRGQSTRGAGAGEEKGVPTRVR